MKRSNERFLFWGMILIVFIVVGAVSFQMVSEKNRDAAVSRINVREPIERYKAKFVKPVAPQAQQQPDATPSTSTKQSKPLTTAEESIAAYASLFDKVEKMLEQEKWKSADKLFNKNSLDDWSQEDWDKARALVAEAREYLLEIRRLAEWGGPAYVIDFSKGIKIDVPHLSKLYDFSVLLREDAIVQGHDKNYAEACEDLIAIMKLANSLKEEPMVSSQTVRYDIYELLLKTVWKSLAPSEIPSEVARKLIDYAEVCTEKSRDAFAESLLTDSSIRIDWFRSIRDGEIADTLKVDDNLTRLGLWVYGSAAARPFMNMDESFYLNKITRVSEIVRLPYIKSKPEIDKINQEIKGMSRAYILSRELLPYFMGIISADARSESMMHLLEVGLSIEQYHIRTKIYPMSLDEVASEYGGRPAFDAFSGKPLVYRIVKDGFMLYSIGENGEDDGGVAKTDDIVWRDGVAN